MRLDRPQQPPQLFQLGSLLQVVLLTLVQPLPLLLLPLPLLLRAGGRLRRLLLPLLLLLLGVSSTAAADAVASSAHGGEGGEHDFVLAGRVEAADGANEAVALHQR